MTETIMWIITHYTVSILFCIIYQTQVAKDDVRLSDLGLFIIGAWFIVPIFLVMILSVIIKKCISRIVFDNKIIFRGKK